MIIAGAGGAAHLPGMTASMTPLPVIGVPVRARSSSTASTRCSRSCRCRPGIPVATVAIGNARNAGLLAVRILANGDEKLRAAMIALPAPISRSTVRDKDAKLREQTLSSRCRRYSVAIAFSTSSLAARRAGRLAQTSVASAVITTMITSWTGAAENFVKPWSCSASHDRPAEEQRHRDPEQRAEQRDDHRLPAHHRTHLPPTAADRAQQPDLARALVDRQRHRVDDADERDDHGEEQQHVDQHEDLVDLLLLIGLVLRVVLQLRVRVRRDERLDRGAALRRRVTPGFSLAKICDVELLRRSSSRTSRARST